MSTRRKSPLSEDWIPSHQCSLDLRLEILSHLPFFIQLSEDEIPDINYTFVERGYEAGEMIYLSGSWGEPLLRGGGRLCKAHAVHPGR
jgi:hypothetical protein